jgi:transposase-like protein
MAPRNRNDYSRSRSSDSTYSRAEFRRDFPDDDACLEWLKDYLYPHGILCDKCKKITPHYRVKSRPSYSCQNCGHHVHPTAGTIFHKSSTSLVLWFEAIYLMSQTRCGISAKQLEREIGVTYKTAWRMMHMIRSLLNETNGPLTGEVEMDETYFNRSKRNRPNEPKRKRGDARPNEQTVFGMVERGGRIVARHVGAATSLEVERKMAEFVLPGSMVFTDEAFAYKGVAKRGYHHKRINHLAKVYVQGDIHTQTIEGFWSLLKRGISGVYHSVSHKYLQMYVDEYAFRYNHRTQVSKPMFWAFLENVEDARLSAGLASDSPS